MPILFLLLLIVLVAQFGFWDTLTAVLGGIGIFILLVATIGALAALAGAMMLRRFRR
ncbi:MAG: hypothetical protein ACK4QW_15695 [Alphaproteobacteria bacterium]